MLSLYSSKGDEVVQLLDEYLSGYIDQSNRSICQATMVYDLARAAEKMADPNYTGEDNDAWQQGPYLSSPANRPQIDHSHPYAMRSSLETQVTAGLIYGDHPPKADHGGVPIPLPNIDGSRVEPYVAKTAIVEQFEILKNFLDGFNGPTNKKRSQEWNGVIDGTVLERMKDVADRRNDLTHESQIALPTMKEAVEYYSECRNLAITLFKAYVRNALASQSDKLCRHP